MCPDQPLAFKKVNNSQAFAQEICFFFFFLNEPVSITPRHALNNIGQIFEDLTAQGHYQVTLTSKVDPTLKLSNYKATARTQIACFPHQSPHVHAVFQQRHILKICTRAARVPVHPFTNGVFVCFFAKDLGFLKVQVLKNRQKHADKLNNSSVTG